MKVDVGTAVLSLENTWEGSRLHLKSRKRQREGGTPELGLKGESGLDSDHRVKGKSR